ncbi:MAG: molybdopterin-dependent oxidoreductase, partial [bacterium]
SIGESSKHEGLERAWGPGIETPDFENTKYILNFGSNIFEAAFSYSQRIVDGRVKNHAKLVTFDVRLSNTAGRSDEWFPVFPGTDGIVALAMANVIFQNGLADKEFINQWTNYPADRLEEYLKQYTPEYAENESGVKAEDIRRIAIEFAKCAPRCTTYSYRGPSMHLNGSYNEKCIFLLNVIVGNIDKEGGFCLPRGFDKGKNPKPEPEKPKHKSILANPPEYPLAHHHVSHHIAQGILEGRQKISVYLLYYYNPLYCNPDSATWEALFKDSEKIPFLVAIDAFISESSALADLILPDATYLERHDPEGKPSSLLPWVGIRQPVVRPLGEAREVREILQELAHKIDPDGSLGIKQYFEYGTTEDFMRKRMDTIPGLKEAGGYDFLKKHGLFPLYDKDAKPGFETYKEKGFSSSDDKAEDKKIHLYVHKWEEYGFKPLPYYWPIPEHREIIGNRSDKLILTTFKVNVHTQSRTSACKWLSEIQHANPMWINPKTAERLGINDGELVRITSKIGYLVTRAQITEGIHPKVVAISTSSGHWQYGSVSQAKKNKKNEFGIPDADVRKNLWWDDCGVHFNKIVPISTDPIGGGFAWFDTVVSVEKAKPEDKYGDCKVFLEKAKEAYHHTLSYTTKVVIKEEGGGH